jgi:hypothetical protein
MAGQPGFRSRQELEGRGGRGRRRAPSSLTGKSLFLTGLVVLLLMSAGMLALRSLAVSIQNGGDDEVTQKKSAPTAVKPTQNKDPFADTLAADYPEGAAGIVLPPAKQVGEWKPAQVQDVLNRTKQTLVAARLDRQMLEQGDPAGYLSTISASARGPVTKSIEAGEGLVYVSRLGAEYKLTGEPRVKGTMAVSLGPKKELVIAADYVWVYPLDGPVGDGAPKGPGSKLVIVHTEEMYQWFEAKKVAVKDTGLRPGAGKLYTVNMDCDLAKTGKLGLQRAAPGNPQDVPDAAAYDPATKPDELPETC